MQCVILAGGRGTRMGTLTAKIPKSLIPVSNKPFLDFLLTHLVQRGVTDVILSIGYKGKMIRDFVKDGAAWKVKVRYVEEGEKLLGTGGALRLALDQGVLEPAFLMTWGDAFLPIDFSDVWNYFEGVTEPVLMTVYKNNHQRGPSNVDFNGKKVVRYDKQAGLRKDLSLHYIDYGLTAFRRSFIEQSVPSGASDLADTLKPASERGDIAGFEVTTPFFEIGSPEGLKSFADAMGLQFNSRFRKS